MNLQTVIFADLIHWERVAEATPARLERRRIARLAEELARCCRTTVGARLRAALRRPARTDACCATA